MLSFLRRVWEDRSGPTAIEYGLIAALVAVATIAGLTELGTNLNSRYNQLSTTVGS
ncbi:MAG: Flp family type IVb pilin [Stellaceae bacterium]